MIGLLNVDLYPDPTPNVGIIWKISRYKYNEDPTKYKFSSLHLIVK